MGIGKKYLLFYYLYHILNSVEKKGLFTFPISMSNLQS